MTRSIDEDEQAVERFIQEAADAETVWGIRTPNGFALLPADSEYAVGALLFFSNAADAVAAGRQFDEGGSAAERLTYTRSGNVPGRHYQSGQPERIALFDFLYRWLQNMVADGLCPGPNWSVPELTGASVRCSELSRRLEERLHAAGKLQEYRARLQHELAEQPAHEPPPGRRRRKD